MQLLADIALAILATYLALTTAAADRLSVLLDQPAAAVPVADEPAGLARLPASVQAIPDILLENSAYQDAAVIGGFTPAAATVDDPREALVNILCTYTTTDLIRTTTGTGFFVHPDGVVLTNAHVAQFFLLETAEGVGDTRCVLRTGDPATPAFEAELLYLPPAWIQEHAALIDATTPSGTGERDYALLYVTAGVENRPMPRVFPALQLDPALLPRSLAGAVVRAAGYPAGALESAGASAPLTPRAATTTVAELYTFGSNYADVFSLRGTAVGEQGSSGGPVVTEDGRVIGMISTRGDDATEGAGSLRAITISHINRTILEETGYDLERNITGNLPYRASLFNETLRPFLTSMLARELQGGE